MINNKLKCTLCNKSSYKSKQESLLKGKFLLLINYNCNYCNEEVLSIEYSDAF